MEEVQSWWEVPAVAHFCYIFRSHFNLFFFEIAELESALLDIQDPDMSISLDQLIIRLLQGCYGDEKEVNESNWEEKLQKLFTDDLEDDVNPLGELSHFFQLTPRSKIEVLLKLCELRIDVEGVLEDIKNIPSEGMQAKCLGKDSQNNSYYYFYDERLYKEDSSASKKIMQPPASNKNAKSATNKNSRQTAREKRNKADPNIDTSWTICCYNISDWEKLLKSFSKTKNTQEKKLCAEIKKHLSVVQEEIAEKDRLLRKRYLELAPKRSSSRITKVQEKKRQEELKAEEEAKKAQLLAEKERARKEALMLKEKQESRQKRADERAKREEEMAREERAERAKLRQMARRDSDVSEESGDEDNSSDNSGAFDSNTAHGIRERTVSRFQKYNRAAKKKYGESEDDSDTNNNYESQQRGCRTGISRVQRTRQNIKKNYYESESDSDESEQKELEKSIPRVHRTMKSGEGKDYTDENNRESRQRTARQVIEPLYHYKSSKTDSKRHGYTFSSVAQQLKDKGAESTKWGKSDIGRRLQLCSIKHANNATRSHKYDRDNNSYSLNYNVNSDIKLPSSTKTENLPKHNSPNLPSSCLNGSPAVNSETVPARVSLHKPAVLQNSSDVAKWHAAFGSKDEKRDILNSSQDNLTSKRIKLEPVTIRRFSPNLVSISKENHVYKPTRQAAFITYGKIVPKQSIVKLDYRKPPNPPISS